MPALPAGAADPIPAGFTVDEVVHVTNQPFQVVAFGFTSGGRLFVAEKGGRVKSYDSIDDASGATIIDIAGDVNSYHDRGLLGLAVDPQFGQGSDYVYVLYTEDDLDTLSDGPGVVNGRLSRFLVSGNNDITGSEDLLLEGAWCAQFPSHTIGDLAFTASGHLLVSAGDGANFDPDVPDHGQHGNPCVDPMGDPTVATDDEGGALRTQDYRTTLDPLGYDGTILRLNKDGSAATGNPTYANGAVDNRVIAHGLRNPFRITERPGTSEIWVGDVGDHTWEEINRIPNPGGSADNFGWPCYEGDDVGSAIHGGYDALNLVICENLYAEGSARAPFYSRHHGDPAGCPGGGGATSGLAFYQGGRYPAVYDGALFIADYSIGCIRVMFPNTPFGVPDQSQIESIVTGIAPVDLQIGPDGDLYYADIVDNTIVRLVYNVGPTAVASATSPVSGPVPLTVQFDATQSTDAEGDPLTYAWDLNGDGQYDDSTASQPTWQYNVPNVPVTVRLRVTDPGLLSHVASIVINPVDHQASISAPLAEFAWQPGQEISFSGGSIDAVTGEMPASSLSWLLTLLHCDLEGECHPHPIETFPGVSSGSLIAPAHPHPTRLVLRLTATDPNGHTDTFEVTSAVGGTQSGGGGGGGGGGSGGGLALQVFEDVPVDHPFYDEINWLWLQRITLGCTAETFCPQGPVTRGEMAVFLARALALLPAPSGQFADTAESPYEWAISSLAAVGITQGCAVDHYCPDDPVTREQMASFLVRAFLFPAGDDLFTDDEESVHEEDINSLAKAGITLGCSPTTFCPAQVVTREQMAAFIFRAYDR
ncbi:MAG: PQQ-dependent sugar dehydrogenase [Acidimicrobiia bacterium]